MVHFNIIPALQMGKPQRYLVISWKLVCSRDTGLIVKLYLLFFLFLHLSLWMAALQGLVGPDSWSGSLVCKLMFMAHFSKCSLQEPPFIKPGIVMPQLQWGRGRWLKHLYLIPTLLSAETPWQLWTSKGEGLTGHWPSSRMLWKLCLSHSIQLGWVSARRWWGSR